MIDTVQRYVYILAAMTQAGNVVLLVAFVLMIACNPPLQSDKETKPIEEITFSYLQDDSNIFVAARLKNPYHGARVDYVQMAWYGMNGLDQVLPDSVFLNDGGDFGDILKGDDLYSRKLSLPGLTNSITYGDTGAVYLRVFAHYGNDSVYTRADSFDLGNIKPRFIWIEAPDTLVRPDSGLAKLVTVKSKLTDANGLEDIQWTGFTSKRLSDGVMLNNGDYIFMIDTGDTTYGDITAGDGIFTTIVALRHNASTGRMEWKFRVQDWSNAFRDTVHIVLVTD